MIISVDDDFDGLSFLVFSEIGSVVFERLPSTALPVNVPVVNRLILTRTVNDAMEIDY